MNIKLNMKDINKILAKPHFKCKYLKTRCVGTTRMSPP